MPKKLTEKQEKLLKRVYYSPEGMRGRDATYNRVRYANVKGDKVLTGISRRQVADWLAKQEVNQIHKPITYKKSVKPILSKRPFQQVQIDLVDLQKESDKFKKWILTAVDTFSKYGFAVAMPSKNEAQALKAIKQVVGEIEEVIAEHKLRPLRVIQSDNGSEFINKAVKEFLKDRGVKQIFSLPYTPQTQGMVERYNGTIKKVMRKMMFVEKSKAWTDMLPGIIEGYNTTYHSTIKKTPLEAVSGDFEDTHNKLITRANKMRSNEVVDVVVGDTVRIYIPKHKSIARKYPNWSTELYTVTQVVHPKKPFSKMYIKVNDDEGNPKGYKYYSNQFIIANEIETKSGDSIKYEAKKKEKVKVVGPKTALAERAELPKRKRKPKIIVDV